MTETVIVAVLSLIGTMAGAYFANKKSAALIAYRLEELAQKVAKHNGLVERTYHLEEAAAVFEEKLKVATHRIDDLERGACRAGIREDGQVRQRPPSALCGRALSTASAGCGAATPSPSSAGRRLRKA